MSDTQKWTAHYWEDGGGEPEIVTVHRRNIGRENAQAEIGHGGPALERREIVPLSRLSAFKAIPLGEAS